MKLPAWSIVWTYLIYVIIWDCGLIGTGIYVVFWLGHSGWWMLGFLTIASCCYSPDKWADLWRPDRRTGEE